MKDFKYLDSVKVQNESFKKGDKVVYSDGRKGVVEEVDLDQSGKLIVYAKIYYEDGDVSYVGQPSSKFRKVGNAYVPAIEGEIDDLTKKGLPYEEIVRKLKSVGYTSQDIAEYEKYIRTHICNSSVASQDWSMFKGLSKDAEKEVGNESIITKDGIRNYPDKEIGEINEKRKELMMWEKSAREDKTKDHSKQIAETKKELSDLRNKYATGNNVGNGEWNGDKTVYGKWEKSGRPSDEYAKITWLGKDRGGLVNLWKGDKLQSEKFGSYDRKELEKWAEQKIGNEIKVGSHYWAKDNSGEEYDVEVMQVKGNKVYVRSKDGRQGWKDAESLKTKVGNGLDRAFRAMNKKCGNAVDYVDEGDYVMYKGRKAVVRSVQGREVVIEQNGMPIKTYLSNLDEWEG